jgi:broad specificity phosphatase PhoE
MSLLRHIVLVRHGETHGESSVRFHGAMDVILSGLGCDQAARVRSALSDLCFDAGVASPLQRAWKSASLVAPGAPIRLEAGFREIDFGRWEGLTLEEIQALDPELCAEWQLRDERFVFPEGEGRLEFRERVVEGLGRVLEIPAESLLVVAHKGVVRTVYEELVGEALPAAAPDLGEHLELVRHLDGAWRGLGLE